MAAGLGLALTLASLGAQAFGMGKSAKEMNALRRKLQERSQSLEDVFNKEYNMDYMQTPGVKNAMASYIEGMKESSKNAAGRAALSGASPEAQIAEEQGRNTSYSDFIRKVAAGQDAYRAEKERIYQQRQDALQQQIFETEKEKASQWDKFAQNVTNLGVAGIQAGAIQEPGTSDWLKNLLKKKNLKLPSIIGQSTLAG